MPDAEKIVLLVRNTLITLNDAIQTSNFTVLRDKGAPGFRDANSAARLGQAFADLASRGVDLGGERCHPAIDRVSTLDRTKGMLNVKGFSRLSRCRLILRCSINRSGGAGGCSAFLSTRARHSHRLPLGSHDYPIDKAVPLNVGQCLLLATLSMSAYWGKADTQDPRLCVR
jgi:hypothetical protein